MAFFQSNHLWINQAGEGVGVLVLDRDGSQVNFLDPAMLDDLDHALDAVIKANEFHLLVIRSGKTGNFCHGPSPTLLASWTKNDFLAWCDRGQKVCSKLAAMTIPSACVIAGTCFDAGLEVALACDHRVVVNVPETSLGFPQLEWGMIPCWGGTQRMPHLIGLDQSLHMLLAGQKMDAKQAWMIGLADDLTEQVDDAPPAFLSQPAKRHWQDYPLRTWRQRWLESNRLGRWFLYRGAERILRTRIPQELPAQTCMLDAIRHAYQQSSIDAGLQFERQNMERVADHPALYHLLRLLLHREQLRLPSIGSADKSRVRQVGIIGGGLAALSLYMQCVAGGYDLVIRSADREKLGFAMVQISQLLDIELKQGNLTQKQLAKVLGNFRGTYTWTHFDKLHLILDTLDGTLAEKQALYQEMEKHASDGATVVPISPRHRIEDLQRGLQHPQRVVGVNLIEPWNRGSLAEIVATAAGGQPHVQRVREWLVGLGRCCLQVPDKIGGLVMRVWLPALNEAGILIKEGVPIDRIDQAMRRFGMSYGPCEWMDRLGVEQVASLVKAMQPTFAGRLNFETGFALMAEKEWTGSMSELGFYEPGLRKPRPHRNAVALWKTQSQGEPAHAAPALSEADAHLWIQNRLVMLMVLEAVRCLEDGLAKDADDLDCAMCLTGWATHRGGPIGYARQVGMEAVMARCSDLAREYGPRFAPFASLSEFLSRG